MSERFPSLAEHPPLVLDLVPEQRSLDQRPAKLFSWTFFCSYLTTMRPYLLFVSGITGVLGMALAPEIPLASASVLILAFFLSYGFGQALTDCFQTDTDALSSNYRPLVRGMVRARDVMTVSLVGLSLIGVVLSVSHLLNLPLTILCVLGLASYTWFKRRWWAGPFYNAWIVAVLLVIGWVSSTGVARLPLDWPKGMTGAVLAAFFGYANFVLAGYFKDISADRATGYNTFPVVFGRKPSVLMSDFFALATLLSALASVLEAGLLRQAITNPATSILAILGVGNLILAQARLHRVREDAQSHRAISMVVHAYILLMASIASAFQEAWAPALFCFYAGFVAALHLRPMREQI